MVRIGRAIKGVSLHGINGGGIKVKDKCITQNQRGGDSIKERQIS